MSLRRGGQYQYPALDTKYEDTKYNESHYLVDDSKYALDTEDSKSFDHLMPSSGYIHPFYKSHHRHCVLLVKAAKMEEIDTPPKN